MKLINTASPTFPCQSGSNTILLPDFATDIRDIIPHDWDMKDVITVTESTHEVDFI